MSTLILLLVAVKPWRVTQNHMLRSHYGHCIVAGVARAPLKVTKGMSEKKVAKRSRVKPFVRRLNYTHVMPTRYSVEFDKLKVCARVCIWIQLRWFSHIPTGYGSGCRRCEQRGEEEGEDQGGEEDLRGALHVGEEQVVLHKAEILSSCVRNLYASP